MDKLWQTGQSLCRVFNSNFGSFVSEQLNCMATSRVENSAQTYPLAGKKTLAYYVICQLSVRYESVMFYSAGP